MSSSFNFGVSDTAQQRILVVDDDSAILNLAGLFLKKKGFLLEVALSPKDVIEKIDAFSPHLLLLDILFPDADGLEVCKKVKNIYPDLPVIIMTAHDDQDTIKRSFDAGADDFIKKPLGKFELLARAGNIISSSVAQKELQKMYDIMENELKTAQKLQRHLLPPPFHTNSNFWFSSVYQPSIGAGGDLFDVFPIDDNRYFFYIGDVSGHGLQAALVMTTVKSMISMIVKQLGESTTPAVLLSRLNTIVAQQFEGKFYLTMLAGVMNTDTMELLIYNAGHPAPVILDTVTHQIAMPEAGGGIPIGWIESFDYVAEDQRVIALGHNDLFFLYTDGIFECRNERDELLGTSLIKDILKDLTPSLNYLYPFYLKERVTAYADDNFDDDFTIVAIGQHNMKAHFIEIAPHLSEISNAMKLFEETLRQSQIGESEISEVRLMLQELINNIVAHGFKESDSSPILFGYDIDNGEFHVLDSGDFWNGEFRPNMRHDDNLHKESGRGVEIIKEISDSFHHERIGDINHSFIIKKLGKKDG